MSLLKLTQYQLGVPETGWWCIASLIGLATSGIVCILATVNIIKLHQVKSLLFAHVMVCSLVFTTIVALRLTAGLFVASWPQRDLRPILLSEASLVDTDAPASLITYSYNSWGMRDAERSIARAPNAKRILFIGDSFLEGGFCRAGLPTLCEELLNVSHDNVECINLGVSGTGPMHYYFRMKNVGQYLSPDAVCLVVYSGNDFLSPDQAYSKKRDSVFCKLLDEAPKPSLINAIAPEINWLLIDRLNLSEHGLGSKKIENETEILDKISRMPYGEAVHDLATHMQKYYIDSKSIDEIEEVLRRGGEEFWDIFKSRKEDADRLMAWWVNGILRWEFLDLPYAKSREDTTRDQIDPFVVATKTWIEAIRNLCDEVGAPLVVVLAPVGAVDSEFVDYYQQYPRYFSYNYYCDARHDGLKKSLEEDHYTVIDLKTPLKGQKNTYRKSDAHWNKHGHEVVSTYLVEQMETKLR